MNEWTAAAIRQFGEDLARLVEAGTHTVTVDLDHHGRVRDVWTLHAVRTTAGWDALKARWAADELSRMGQEDGL